ncbi:MAG: pilus assembly protein PilM, partial [Deltaproteobacteria bacterium]|nr:pilus assembly protein PilM [Deltaproteobacteria bacterium]
FLKTMRLAEVTEPFQEELPLFLKSIGLRNQRVTTYLPRKLVNVRFLEVPSTDPEEVDAMIRLQGVKQTPYSREEVSLSHTIVRSRHEGMSDVVLAFCQRKFVDERIALLGKAGLKVDQMGVSSEGVLNWYLRNQADEGFGIPQGLVALIDCDSAFSDLLFCRDGKFLFSRSISSGSSQFGPDFEELFCEEVLRAVELTQEEIKLTELKKVVLIASLPPDSKLRGALESKLGLSVEFLDPALSLKGETESLLAKGGAITPLIGFAAMERPLLFDLMPEEAQLKLSVEKKGKQMVVTGALALGFLAVMGLLFAGYFYGKKNHLERLEKEIEKTEEIASRIEGKLVRTKLLQRTKNQESSLLYLLMKISGLLPRAMYFNSIEFTYGEKLVLKGYAGEMSEVFDFVKILEEAKIFKGVKSEHVSKKKSGDQILADFEITCRL